MPVLEADIISRWVRADSSENRLEAAETEVPGLFALRCTYDRRQVAHATADQIMEFARQALDPDSTLGQMLEEGRRGERNGHRNGHDRDDARNRGRDRDRETSAR